jgi:hypothetical protein
MTSHPLGQWFVAFLWTSVFELPVYVLMLRKYFAAWWVPWLVTLLANSCTHPALWYLFPRFDPGIPFLHPYVAWAAMAESCVVVTEAVMVSVALSFFSRSPCPSVARRMRIALVSSLIANLTSTLLGIVLLGVSTDQ